MTMRMDGDQGLLQQVLGVRRTMPDLSEAASVVGAQMRSEPLQKLMIGARVAVEASCHESSKLVFVRMCEFVHL